jgi:hypothetical protein
MAQIDPAVFEAIGESSRYRCRRTGCVITTRWGRTPERKLMVEHVELRIEPEAVLELAPEHDTKGLRIYK